MSQHTVQQTTQRDERRLGTRSSNAATDAPNNPAPINPGPSRQQAMLSGIVGEGLEEITRRVPLDEPPPLSQNGRLSAIGKPIQRFDAVQKVTGRARYTFDVQLPGMLYARRVVSDVPHGRIMSIDSSAAEKYPGVRAVHVLERIRGSAQLRDPSAEASHRYPTVRYAGQPVAAVAADTPRAAEAAARLVKVIYEPLPHVSSLDEAMQEGAPLVFPGPTEQAATAGGGGRGAWPAATWQRAWPRHWPATRRTARGC